jgi:hypothetical protein
MDAAMIRAASWTGVFLLANDGLATTAQIRSLMRRLVLAGGVLGLLGLAQFATGTPLVDILQIPGFTQDPSAGIEYRGDFTRASGTATHPLEYAVVVSATLPLAIALAVRDTGSSVVRRWWAPLVLTLAAIVSVSRSAIIGVLLSVLVLTPALSRAMRWLIAFAGLALVTLAFVAVPGLVGTLRGLFQLAGSDASAASRTDAAEGAVQIAANYGPFGRGFGSFLPSYLVLDNQVLGLYIEIGAVGVLAFAGLIAAGLTVGLLTAKELRPDPDAVLVQGLAAALAGAAALFLFFDAFSFTMAGGVLFLLLGMIGGARSVDWTARRVPDESRRPGTAA